MDLKGKKALITGSSRGIGRGIALTLAERGADIAVHYYQNRKAAEETAQKIRALGRQALLVQADVAKPDEVTRMVKTVGAELGQIDVFISNARTEPPTFYSPPFDITLEQWDTALDSQAKAFLVAVRELVDVMPDGGRIIAITYAPGGQHGSWQSWVAMGAAKAALEVLCRYFAVCLAPRAITVNAISPGWVEDTVLNALPEPVQESIRAWHASGWTPMRRLGSHGDIGGAVALLCSPESSWITGQLINADGGASLMDARLPLEIQQPFSVKKAQA